MQDFQVYLIPIKAFESFFPNTLKVLEQNNILFVGDLAAVTREELLTLPGLGPKRVLELECHLATVDVCLGEQAGGRSLQWSK